MRNRILIVNVNWVGDTLFSTPFIRAVRQAYPSSYIASLLHPRCFEILEGNPRLDDIIVYDEEGEHKSILGKLRLILALRRRHFDTAFLLHRSFTKALMTFLAGIKERIGYPTKNRSFVLTKAVEEGVEEAHKVEYFLNIARAAGIKAEDASYEFFVKEKDKTFTERFLKENGVKEDDLLIAVCPGGNWEPKRWPKEKFARLSDILIERFRAKVVITGARKDMGLADAIKGMMRHDAIIACGKTTLKQLGALLGRMRVVIANDTGPMHIAVAMKTKVIALFGPTSSRITGPYGSGNYRTIFKNTDCEVPCYDVTCNDNRCMTAIGVEDVLKEVDDMLMKDKSRVI